jgi:hypothetical protein
VALTQIDDLRARASEKAIDDAARRLASGENFAVVLRDLGNFLEAIDELQVPKDD